ncbi:MAG: NAD-dependent epimerase/dehydratase family protein [Verrucomicrobiota bacterium]|nr:NAD-dependent epimerase/dehydratase family protein [Verrucomicrobiota bacterium]
MAGETDLPANDLQEVLAATAPLWEAARGEAIFVTGGTGFFGRWLLGSFAHANAKLELGARMVVLTRNAAAFRKRASGLSRESAIALVEGDVRTFRATNVSQQLGENAPNRYRFVIHAATAASAAGVYGSAETVDTVVQGTQAALRFAAEGGAERFLFTSSGAVYGPQPPHLGLIAEDYSGGPELSSAQSAYGEAKRLAEVLCVSHGSQQRLAVSIARCFAFVGPYLPLDAQFAVGNFLQDSLHGRAISVSGDGTARRSYLYATDLAVALWTILFSGAPGRAYNVGSEEDVSVAELAHFIARLAEPPLRVAIAQRAEPGTAVRRYLPSTERLRTELGFAPRVSLREALVRTHRWLAEQAHP